MGTVVEEQLQTIQDNVDDAYTALSSKGATLPAVGSRGTENLASTVATVPSPDPVNKAFDVTNGVLDKAQVTFSANTFASVTKVDNRGMYYSFNNENKAPIPQGVVSFPNLTSVGYEAFVCAFKKTGITSVSFPELTADSNYCFQTAFGTCRSLTTINFQKLATSSRGSFQNCFQYCYALTSAAFPALTSIGENSFDTTFQGCSALTTVNFPELLTVGRNGMYRAFYSCSSLTTVNFPKLTSLGSAGLYSAFYKCDSLTTISFPSLTTVSSDSFGTGGFSSCTNLTEIHFPAAIQATIEAMSGYSSKWGATNATIYFDL